MLEATRKKYISDFDKVQSGKKEDDGYISKLVRKILMN